jgi:hypothetical protein
LRANGEIEENVDPIAANSLGQLFVAPTGGFAPDRRGGLKPGGQLILDLPVAIANRLALFTIEVLHRADQKMPHGVMVEVGRNESHAKSAQRITVVLVRPPMASQRRGVPSVEFGMGRNQLRERGAHAILEGQQKVAVRTGRVGLQLQGSTVADDRLVRLSLISQRGAEMTVSLGIVGLEFGRPPIAGNRVAPVALLPEDVAEVVVRLDQCGMQLQRAAAASDRLVELALGLERRGQVAVGLRMIGLQFQSPAIAGDRRVQLALILQRDGHVVECAGVVRLELQYAAVTGDGVVQFSLAFDRDAQVVMRFGRVGPQFQRSAVAADRLVEVVAVFEGVA